ncbi:UNVERIFIED_CONTAM: clostripain-related cysteine peptidase [Microbacterium sp. SLM126]
MSTERFMWLVAIPVIAIFATIAVVLYGIGGEAGAPETDDDAGASWTFMVYMMGDTNLEPYALDDLAEMASVGSSDDLNIVAMVDRSPDYSSDGVENLPDWEDTKLLEVQQGEFVELDDLGELNTGSPDTLSSFVETAAAEYPADNYALLLWDHGGGWLGMGADETDGEDGLELDEISQGIDAGLAAAGVEKLDLLGFDACLMATFEVASTLAPYADYLVASEEVEPGHGWNYGQLDVISEDPGIAAPDLAAAMIEGYSAQAEEEGTESDITLGLLDLAAVDDLEAAMNDVAAAFVTDPAAFSPDIASAQHDVLEFGRDPDPANSMYQIDLGGFLQNLADDGDADLAARADAAIEALDAVVLEHIAGPATSASTGLSIYFPPTANLFYDDYLSLQDVPAWPAMLAEYFATGAALAEGSRAEFHETLEPVVAFGVDGVDVFAPMPAAGAESVADASVAVGFENDGELVYMLETPATLTEQDGAAGVEASYDLTYLTISDGTEDALAYQSIGIDPGTGHTVIDIPVDYVAPGDAPTEYEDALITIVLDEDGEIIEQDFFAKDASGSLGAFEPDPDGMLFPVALASIADGEWIYEQTGVEGIAADLGALEFVAHDLPEGVELTLDLSVTDFGGRSDYTSVSVTVP